MNTPQHTPALTRKQRLLILLSTYSRTPYALAYHLQCPVPSVRRTLAELRHEGHDVSTLNANGHYRLNNIVRGVHV